MLLPRSYRRELVQLSGLDNRRFYFGGGRRFAAGRYVVRYHGGTWNYSGGYPWIVADYAFSQRFGPRVELDDGTTLDVGQLWTSYDARETVAVNLAARDYPLTLASASRVRMVCVDGGDGSAYFNNAVGPTGPMVWELIPQGVNTWTPARLPGIYAWWRADAGLTPAGALADGVTISSWADRRVGLSVSQASPYRQPVYRANGAGGKPYLQFSGQAELFGATAAAMDTPTLLLWAVCRNTNPHNGNAYQGVLTLEGVDTFIGFLSDVGLATFVSYPYTDPGTPISPGWGTITGLRDGYEDLRRVRWNNQNEHAGDGNTAGAWQGVRVGGTNSYPNNQLQGDIAELVICTALPSEADLATLQAYASDRYGI